MDTNEPVLAAPKRVRPPRRTQAIAVWVRPAERAKVQRLAAYASDIKKIGDLRHWRRLADYIPDRKGGGEGGDAIRVTNCFNEEPGPALAEIAAIQDRNTTSKADKTYHLIVSFPPGETPTPAQLYDIEDTLCAAISLADHQRISAAHNDKNHFHFHVAINKVHPTTLRAVTPYFDQARLPAACVAIEQKHGLTPTNHWPDRSAERDEAGRAAGMELYGGPRRLVLSSTRASEEGPLGCCRRSIMWLPSIYQLRPLRLGRSRVRFSAEPARSLSGLPQARQ